MQGCTDCGLSLFSRLCPSVTLLSSVSVSHSFLVCVRLSLFSRLFPSVTLFSSVSVCRIPLWRLPLTCPLFPQVSELRQEVRDGWTEFRQSIKELMTAVVPLAAEGEEPAEAAA